MSVIAIWTEAGQKATKAWSAGVNCQHGAASAPVSWTFPVHDGTSGDTLEIDASGGDSHGSDSWTYRYRWGSADFAYLDARDVDRRVGPALRELGRGEPPRRWC